VSREVGAPFCKQIPQNRSVALPFVFAIASKREVGLMRQRGEQIEISCGLGLFHFRAKASLERSPSCIVGYRKEFL
jgi:hypothetical protein